MPHKLTITSGNKPGDVPVVEIAFDRPIVFQLAAPKVTLMVKTPDLETVIDETRTRFIKSYGYVLVGGINRVEPLEFEIYNSRAAITWLKSTWRG